MYQNDLNWLHLASKYLSKTFGHFDNVYALSLPHITFDLIAAKLPGTVEQAIV